MALEMQRVCAGYGDVPVLSDVDLRVGSSETVALVGSNGAGKTTLLKTIAGLLDATAGDILFEGQPVTSLRADSRIERGIVLVPEGRRLFGGMTVRQNLLMGAYLRRDRAAIRARLEGVFDVFPRLRERSEQLAGSLSGGEQQMCAIGRGLMAEPKLLMVDELSLGLAPVAVDQLLEVLRQVRARGTALLLVEQDVRLALSIADRAYVLQTGSVVLAGTAAEVGGDPSVRTAYLGI